MLMRNRVKLLRLLFFNWIKSKRIKTKQNAKTNHPFLGHGSNVTQLFFELLNYIFRLNNIQTNLNKLNLIMSLFFSGNENLTGTRLLHL